jgi:hypothetical protein
MHLTLLQFAQVYERQQVWMKRKKNRTARYIWPAIFIYRKMLTSALKFFTRLHFGFVKSSSAKPIFTPKTMIILVLQFVLEFDKMEKYKQICELSFKFYERYD